MSFENLPRKLTSPADYHAQIVPSDTADLNPRPRVIYCAVSSNAVIRDQAGTDLTYALVAGQVLQISPVRVLATGTTATLYGWR